VNIAMDSESLLGLARSRAPADRERLLLGVVDLCAAGQAAASAATAPPVQALLSSIFMSLVVEAERDIRQRLAEKLATAEWAPPTLINVLALDEIEIARPIIAASPLLQDADLIRLQIEATTENQMEVARRPNLGAEVVAAILRKGEPAVLTALAGNATAELSEPDMRELVGLARRIAALRSPLSRHPKLSNELALELYVWVGQSVRRALSERFHLDSPSLDAALAETVREAHGGVSTARQGLVVVARDGEREEMERRLIDKLHAAGQLRPGYLVRALREGRLSLFSAALARLGRFDADQIRRAIDCDRPELLALACAAVGIDRSVFPTILGMVRQLNGGRPAAGQDGPRPGATFGPVAPVAPQLAGAAFRQAAATA